MKVGVLPTYHGELVADPEYAVGFARLCEASGCESVWAVEHVVVPADYASRYPYAPDGRMPLTGREALPDPLDWLAFVAGATERLRLATGILVLPEHNPVLLAKRLATIDALSNGRLLLGVGVGWLREEADAVGTDFDDRGLRADEYIEAMRVLWGPDPSSFEGRTVHFRDVWSRPKPVQAGGVPILVGGHSRAAARRAGRLGDGFFPLGVDVDDLGGLLDVVRSEATEAGRDPDAIEITVSGTTNPEKARRYRDLGVSRMVVSTRGATDLEGAKRVLGDVMETVDRL